MAGYAVVLFMISFRRGGWKWMKRTGFWLAMGSKEVGSPSLRIMCCFTGFEDTSGELKGALHSIKATKVRDSPH